jgi:DNA-binding NarL/FixJ family response regulator
VTEVVVEYRGRRSAPVTLSVVDAAPALFTLDSSGRGQAAMLNETGCCNSARNPAARGSVVSLYATGEGQTNQPGITGLISAYAKTTAYPTPRRKVRVTVGGQPAEILFASEAPHTVTGFLQVNFRIPLTAPLVLTVGDARSQDGLTMAVRTAVKQIALLDLPPATRTRLSRLLTAAGYHIAPPDQKPIDLVISSLDASEQISAIRAAQPRTKLIAMPLALDPDTLRSADLLGPQAVLTEKMTSQAMLRCVRELLRPRIVPYVAPTDLLSRHRLREPALITRWSSPMRQLGVISFTARTPR